MIFVKIRELYIQLYFFLKKKKSLTLSKKHCTQIIISFKIRTRFLQNNPRYVTYLLLITPTFRNHFGYRRKRSLRNRFDSSSIFWKKEKKKRNGGSYRIKYSRKILEQRILWGGNTLSSPIGEGCSTRVAPPRMLTRRSAACAREFSRGGGRKHALYPRPMKHEISKQPSNPLFSGYDGWYRDSSSIFARPQSGKEETLSRGDRNLLVLP